MKVKLREILTSVLDFFKPKTKTSTPTIIIVQNVNNSEVNVTFSQK